MRTDRGVLKPASKQLCLRKQYSLSGTQAGLVAHFLCAAWGSLIADATPRIPGDLLAAVIQNLRDFRQSGDPLTVEASGVLLVSASQTQNLCYFSHHPGGNSTLGCFCRSILSHAWAFGQRQGKADHIYIITCPEWPRSQTCMLRPSSVFFRIFPGPVRPLWNIFSTNDSLWFIWLKCHQDERDCTATEPLFHRRVLTYEFDVLLVRVQHDVFHFQISAIRQKIQNLVIHAQAKDTSRSGFPQWISPVVPVLAKGPQKWGSKYTRKKRPFCWVVSVSSHTCKIWSHQNISVSWKKRKELDQRTFCKNEISTSTRSAHKPCYDFLSLSTLFAVISWPWVRLPTYPGKWHQLLDPSIISQTRRFCMLASVDFRVASWALCVLGLCHRLRRCKLSICAKMFFKAHLGSCAHCFSMAGVAPPEALLTIRECINLQTFLGISWEHSSAIGSYLQEKQATPCWNAVSIHEAAVPWEITTRRKLLKFASSNSVANSCRKGSGK